MTIQQVVRPVAPSKKVNTGNDFELCFLRHQYFRRVNYNPTEADMKPYMAIVEHLTKNTFFVYFNLFKTVGMYHDDILNIGRVHLVSFLGLYSLDNNEKKRLEFEERFEKLEFKKPEQKDIEQKNKANFTLFFKQRMEDLVRVCRQKVRNIKGQSSEEFLVYKGKEKLPKYPRTLIRSHEELGYKKIDFAIFKSIRKKANVNVDATIFEFDGFWYVALPIEQRSLELEDLVVSDLNPYHNYHYMQPDEILDEKEQNSVFEMFESKTESEKRVLLRNFIVKKKHSKYYKKEILVAKKMLKSLGG